MVHPCSSMDIDSDKFTSFFLWPRTYLLGPAPTSFQFESRSFEVWCKKFFWCVWHPCTLLQLQLLQMVYLQACEYSDFCINCQVCMLAWMALPIAMNHLRNTVCDHRACIFIGRMRSHREHWMGKMAMRLGVFFLPLVSEFWSSLPVHSFCSSGCSCFVFIAWHCLFYLLWTCYPS